MVVVVNNFEDCRQLVSDRLIVHSLQYHGVLVDDMPM